MRILVDMDGVLADYNEALIREGLLTPIEFTAERWEECPIDSERKNRIREFVRTPGFYASLRPIPGAIEAVQELQRIGFEIAVCSQPPRRADSWAEKYTWLEQKTPFLMDHISLTNEKHTCHGDAFVEDTVSALLRWPYGRRILLQSNPQVIYETMPSSITRFLRWEEVVRYLQAAL